MTNKKEKKVSGKGLLTPFIDDELLGSVEIVETKEEVKAVIKPKTEKVMIGFHPITGEEVWM